MSRVDLFLAFSLSFALSLFALGCVHRAVSSCVRYARREYQRKCATAQAPPPTPKVDSRSAPPLRSSVTSLLRTAPSLYLDTPPTLRMDEEKAQLAEPKLPPRAHSTPGRPQVADDPSFARSLTLAEAGPIEEAARAAVFSAEPEGLEEGGGDDDEGRGGAVMRTSASADQVDGGGGGLRQRRPKPDRARTAPPLHGNAGDDVPEQGIARTATKPLIGMHLLEPRVRPVLSLLWPRFHLPLSADASHRSVSTMPRAGAPVSTTSGATRGSTSSSSLSPCRGRVTSRTSPPLSRSSCRSSPSFRSLRCSDSRRRTLRYAWARPSAVRRFGLLVPKPAGC